MVVGRKMPWWWVGKCRGGGSENAVVVGRKMPWWWVVKIWCLKSQFHVEKFLEIREATKTTTNEEHRVEPLLL